MTAVERHMSWKTIVEEPSTIQCHHTDFLGRARKLITHLYLKFTGTRQAASSDRKETLKTGRTKGLSWLEHFPSNHQL